MRALATQELDDQIAELPDCCDLVTSGFGGEPRPPAC
jgi:hypothetical protein